MGEEEDAKYNTIYNMMESCKMTYTQAKEIYPLVNEVASVAASKIGSLREVVANVIAANTNLLPQDNEVCAKVIIYLTDVYLFNRELYG